MYDHKMMHNQRDTSHTTKGRIKLTNRSIQKLNLNIIVRDIVFSFHESKLQLDGLLEEKREELLNETEHPVDPELNIIRNEGKKCCRKKIENIVFLS